MLQKIAKYKVSKPFETDEIDLVAIIRTLWQGKWIILLTMLLSCVAAFLFYQFKPSKISFSAGIAIIKTTDNTNLVIEQITNKLTSLLSSEVENKQPNDDLSNINTENQIINNKNNKEIKLNALNFIPVTQKSLLNLYLDNIVSSEVVTQAVTASKLFTDNNSDKDYQDKLQSIIRAIKIFQVALPNTKSKAKEFEKLSYQYRLDFTFKDVEKGKLFLANLHQFTNKKVRNIIIENYNQNINSFEYLRSLKLDEINDTMQSVLFTYEETIKQKLEYLKEQSQIARTLGIAKNTIGTENFSVGNGSITNVKTDTPFYFRGYEAIEKEIQLIQARKDPRLYANGIIELEKQKKSLEDNKNITNIKFVLSNSDLSKEDTFKAADLIALDETANSRLILMLLIAIVAGFVLSCLFVLARNSLRT